MRIVEHRYHSDNHGGLYILEDGRAVYWLGQETPVYVIDKNGVRSVIENDGTDESVSFFAGLEEAEKGLDSAPGRLLTKIEEDILELVVQGGIDALVNGLNG